MPEPKRRGCVGGCLHAVFTAVVLFGVSLGFCIWYSSLPLSQSVPQSQPQSQPQTEEQRLERLDQAIRENLRIGKMGNEWATDSEEERERKQKAWEAKYPDLVSPSRADIPRWLEHIERWEQEQQKAIQQGIKSKTEKVSGYTTKKGTTVAPYSRGGRR